MRTYTKVNVFKNHLGTLQEIKYTDIPSSAPKSERYQWQWIPTDCEPIDLIFKYSTLTSRIFENGNLIITDTSAIFKYDGQQYNLVRF